MPVTLHVEEGFMPVRSGWYISNDNTRLLYYPDSADEAIIFSSAGISNGYIPDDEIALEYTPIQERQVDIIVNVRF